MSFKKNLEPLGRIGVYFSICPNPKDLKFLPYVKVDSKNGGPAFGFMFIVTGPGFQQGVTPLSFNVIYNANRYKFRDGKVTHLNADNTPVVRCR